jgi:hypothetical protein
MTCMENDSGSGELSEIMGVEPLKCINFSLSRDYYPFVAASMDHVSADEGIQRGPEQATASK